MTRHTSFRCTVALASWLALGASPAAAQDSFARAKDFYASAAYEEALQVLDKLHNSSPTVDSTEIAAYQVYCLVALGRSDEATRAIEAIVKADPLYRPSEAEASPRVRTFFENVRKPLLPDVVRDSYSKGKEAFARKDWPAATAEFDQVIALIDELGSAADPGLADIRTLATGFRDLSKSAPAPTPDPPPAPAPSTDPASAPGGGDAAASAPTPAPAPTPEVRDYYGVDDADVVRPVAIAQSLPPWNPDNPVDKLRGFRGTLEVMIDETGKVVSAVLSKPVNPSYDPLLLRAAKQWTFRPATKNGAPVKYRYLVDIKLGK
ncbi:MAG TPA: hypothetical protein VLT86_20650 [Vicinamibacterales bacterium]|nr:hypothetical protein [Vicinamibacterales bacterium]